MKVKATAIRSIGNVIKGETYHHDNYQRIEDRGAYWAVVEGGSLWSTFETRYAKANWELKEVTE